MNYLQSIPFLVQKTLLIGAIKILNSLGIIDYLSFGSEIGQIKPLDDVASILAKEPREFSNILKKQLKSGLSYPKAREVALQMYFGNSPIYMEALQNPNNILGVEYLKAIKRTNSSITPITIKRENSQHNTSRIKNGITSSTGIREMLKEGKNIHQVVPFETYEMIEKIQKKGNIISSINIFENEIIYILRKMPLKDIANLPDVSEGLENKIKQAVNSCNDLNTLINKIKSKNITQTRIQRILLYALLGITKKDMQISQKINPYIRILGFNSHGKRIISAIAENNPKSKIIVSVNKFLENNKDLNLQNMMMKDILATNIYTLKFKTNPLANLDYTHKILELK